MPEVTDSKSVSDQPVKPLKSTLNLPQTSFAMKANLPVNEPLRLAVWQQQDLYAQIRAARAGRGNRGSRGLPHDSTRPSSYSAGSIRGAQRSHHPR